MLSPACWLKLMLFLHAGDTEVGGFGRSAETDLLYLEDFQSVNQHATAVTVALEDDAVADYFDQCVDEGLPPQRFGRIWVHTHPGDSPLPSSTDEATFARVFGSCDWAIMLIVSRTGRTYCRLSFSAGPGGAVLLPVRVDWASWPQHLLEAEAAGPSLSQQYERWMDEYAQNVFHEWAEPFNLRVDVSSRQNPASWTQDWWREDELYGVLDEADAQDVERRDRPSLSMGAFDHFDLGAAAAPGAEVMW